MKQNYQSKDMKSWLRLMALLLCLSPLSIFAQTKLINGQVTSSTNKDPMPGVGITVKGTTRGTTTDASGKFKIEATSSETLVFSFIGFISQEVKVGNMSSLDISLVEDTQNLEEVIVTALGIKKESKKLGYSAESVKVNEIQQNRTVNIMTSLEGKIAGLDITPPSSGAGSSTKIRLRGQSAFAGANNSPLIVINGLPMNQ